jgi:sRNA-binding protein
VKHWAKVAILAPLFASLAFADDFKTINGKEYKDATVSRVEPDGIVVRTKSGITKIYFVELPKDVADKWLAPIRAAEQAAEENRIKEQRAAEEKRIQKQQAAEEERAAAEQERTEKENKAAVELKPAIGQFQAAEQRASQAYQSATKGTLSGQVFVSSSGGQSFKLGAVHVGLFARDAIDVLLPALKRYADFKIQELSPLVDAAKRADSTSDEYYKLLIDRASYYSGSFYFGYLQNPIQTAETDADGKFALNVPKQGSFVLAAKSQRYVGKTFIGDTGIDQTEYYYWLEPISLDGQQQVTKNLSNNNLTSATGTSSLIITKDSLE